MNKFQVAIDELKTKGTTTFKAFGNSMTPILTSGCTLTFEPQAEYEVGDIVIAKVNGRVIPAHKITKKDKQGDSYRYMISNNKGHENGWTHQVFGKVVKVE